MLRVNILHTCDPLLHNKHSNTRNIMTSWNSSVRPTIANRLLAEQNLVVKQFFGKERANNKSKKVKREIKTEQQLVKVEEFKASKASVDRIPSLAEAQRVVESVPKPAQRLINQSISGMFSVMKKKKAKKGQKRRRRRVNVTISFEKR